MITYHRMDPNDEVPNLKQVQMSQQRSSVIVSRPRIYSSTSTNSPNGHLSPSDLSMNGHFPPRYPSINDNFSPSDLSSNGNFSPSDRSTNGHFSPRQSDHFLPSERLKNEHYSLSQNGRKRPSQDAELLDQNYRFRDERDDRSYRVRDEPDRMEESRSTDWTVNRSWQENHSPYSLPPCQNDAWDPERSSFLPSTSSRASFQKDERESRASFQKDDRDRFVSFIPPKKRRNEMDYVKEAGIKTEPRHERQESQPNYPYFFQQVPLANEPRPTDLSLQGFPIPVASGSQNHVKIEVEDDHIVEVTIEENHENHEIPENEKTADEGKVDKRPVDNCHVCGDKAIAHMHYGGICCYSCKAFFRRAVQSEKDKNYTCKKDNDCQITTTTRRLCQKCRFKRCQTIGMTPTWVLSDQQCQIRFGNRATKPSESNNGALVPVVPAILHDPTMLWTQEESHNLKHMNSMYEGSKEMINFSEQNKLVWEKVFLPNGDQEHVYSASDLVNVIYTLIDKINFFMAKNDNFQSLRQNDRTKLLHQNMNEICQLRGAIRFDIKTKNFEWYLSTKDQLALTSEHPQKTVKTTLPIISNNALSTLYSSPSDVSNVVGTIDQFARLQLPKEVYLILMNICAFSPDNCDLEEVDKVEKMRESYLLMLHRFLIQIEGNDADGIKFAAIKMGQIMSAVTNLRECCDKREACGLATHNVKPEAIL